MKEVFRLIAKVVSTFFLAIFFQLMFGSCTQPERDYEEHVSWRYTSFTKLDISTISIPVSCISHPEEISCSDFINSMSPIETSGSGSGMVISHTGEMTFILTAAHVCRDRRNYDMSIATQMGNAVLTVEERSTLESTDYFGNRHSTSLFSIDSVNDICIITSPGTWGEPVPISQSEPEVGERVFNVAAPLGIFEPRMVPMLEGRYVGRGTRRRSFYTVPTGPGSSGSSIMNRRGEIVGVIHSAFTQFENMAISSTLDDIRRLTRTIENQTD